MARHLHPQDVVPRLRTDLNVTTPPTGAGAEVIQVGPIGSTDRFALHGFEFSIALMLDGKRTVAELVRACERLGLPVELEALEGFFEQLKGYGLLAKGQPEPAERTRRPWSPVVRRLFRDALQEVRTGKPAGARADLEQLLSVAPQTPEALALRRWLDANPTGAPDGETFEHLVRAVEEGWVEERKPAWRELVRSAIHRSKWPVVILLGGLAPLIALAVLPLPRVVSASAKLTPVSQVAFFSPASGVVDEVRVREGDPVEAGQVLFTWDTADLDLRLFMARNRLDETRAALDDPGAADTPMAMRARRYQLELAALEQQRAALEVRSPAAGVVTHLGVISGLGLAQQQTVAQIDDTRRLEMVAVTTAREAASLHPGEPVTLRFGAVRVKTNVEAVSEYEVGAEIDNSAGLLQAGSAPVDLELAPRSLYERLLH